jgi:coproporphyrinogen III oxidase
MSREAGTGEAPDVAEVRAHLLELQDRICAALEAEDATARFREQRFETAGGGLARPRALEGGPVIEKSAVHFSHTRGTQLPAAATERRPELAGRGYEAVSISLIVHPRNPFVPTSHMNLRFFQVPSGPSEAASWWFGGGFDLTPCYGYEQDCVLWHQAARTACETLGPGAYPALKKACDEYFFLPHRGEPRGIGGIFFDDLREGGFARCFAFVRAVGEQYLATYPVLVARRKTTPYGDRERDFQLYRRGRYAEFNLVHDRGTRFGLQSGGRVESILASLPPLVAWRYDWRPEPGSPEARLGEEFLRARDWL